jgi:nicotinic acid mononucleotide adenylyltransferase
VLAGYISTGHEHYILSKQNYRYQCDGTRSLYFDTRKRIRMCQIATAESPWIDAATWESAHRETCGYFGMVIEELQREMMKEFPDAFIFYVCGADLIRRCPFLVKRTLYSSINKHLGVVVLRREGEDHYPDLPEGQKDLAK